VCGCLRINSLLGFCRMGEGELGGMRCAVGLVRFFVAEVLCANSNAGGVGTPAVVRMRWKNLSANSIEPRSAGCCPKCDGGAPATRVYRYVRVGYRSAAETASSGTGPLGPSGPLLLGVTDVLSAGCKSKPVR